MNVSDRKLYIFFDFDFELVSDKGKKRKKKITYPDKGTTRNRWSNFLSRWTLHPVFTGTSGGILVLGRDPVVASSRFRRQQYHLARLERSDGEDREFWAWARDMHQGSRRPDGTSRSFVLARCRVFQRTRRRSRKQAGRKSNQVDIIIYLDLSFNSSKLAVTLFPIEDFYDDRRNFLFRCIGDVESHDTFSPCDFSNASSDYRGWARHVSCRKVYARKRAEFRT